MVSKLIPMIWIFLLEKRVSALSINKPNLFMMYCST